MHRSPVLERLRPQPAGRRPGGSPPDRSPGQPNTPSPALFENVGNRFRRDVKDYAAQHGIPILALKKPDRTRFDDRKLDHVRPYMDAAERAERFGVVAIVSTQEFEWVLSAHDRAREPGAVF